MAASRTPQQSRGNHRYACTEHAASLRSRAFVSSRPASTAASQVSQTAEPRAISHAEVAQRASSAEASSRKTRPTRKRYSSPGLEFLAPERLTAAIRACASTADLLALHRQHGAAFNHIHACAALHRLVDVAALTADDDDSPTEPQSSTEPHPLQSSAPSNKSDGASLTTGPQLTGRLRVRQGQQVSETSASVPWPNTATAPASTNLPTPQQQAERVRSNAEASTSAPSTAPHPYSLLSSSSSRLGRVHSNPNTPPQQAQHATSGRIQNSSSGSLPGAHTAPEPPLSGCDDEQIVELGARLAAILQRSCRDLDGRGVATAASALSRLRYAHAELLRQLERRSLELLRAQLKTAAASEATGAGHNGRVGKCTSAGVNVDLGRTGNVTGAPTTASAAAAPKPGKLKKSLEPNDGGGVPVDGASSATQLMAPDAPAAGSTRATRAGDTPLKGGGSAHPSFGRTDLRASGVTTQPAPQEVQVGSGSSEHGDPSPLGHPHAAGQLQLQEPPRPEQEQQQQQGVRAKDAGCLSKRVARSSAPGSVGVDHLPAPSCHSSLNPEELYALVAAFGSLTHVTSREWQAAVIAALQPHLPSYAAPQVRHIPARLPALLCNLVNSGARPPTPWIQAACAAARPHLPSYNARQLRSLVTGLAALQHRPDGPWVNEYLAASEAALPACGAEDLEVVLKGLADLGCRPRESWMAAFYERSGELVMSAGGITGAQASSLLAALSRLSLRPSSEWLSTLLIGTRRGLFDISAAQLTQHLTALSALRFRPPEPWLQHYYTASFQRLPFHTPQQAVDAATALAALGVAPQSTWLQELGRQLGGKLGLLLGGQQAAALGALVELGYKPAAAWLAGYEKASNGRLAGCSVKELCRALAALAEVGFKPHASWLYSFIMAAYSKLDAFDAAQLALVFESLPALAPHGSWLDEIIQICAAESAMRSQPAAAREAVSVSSAASSSPTTSSLIGAAASSNAASEEKQANTSMTTSSTTATTAVGASSASASVVVTSTAATTTTVIASGPQGGQHQDLLTSRGGTTGSRVAAVSGGPAAVLAGSGRGAGKGGAVSGSLPERLEWASMKVRRGEQQGQQLQRQRQLVGRHQPQQVMAVGAARVGVEGDALQQVQAQGVGMSGLAQQGVSQVGGRVEGAVEEASQPVGPVAAATGAELPGQGTTLPGVAAAAAAAAAVPLAVGADPVSGSAVVEVEGATGRVSMAEIQQGRGYTVVGTSGAVGTSGGLFTSGAVTMGTINDYHPDGADGEVEGEGDGSGGPAAAAGDLGDGLAAQYDSATGAGASDVPWLTSATVVESRPAARVLGSLETETQPLTRTVATMAQLDVGRMRVVVDGPVTITTEPPSIENGLVTMEPPSYIGRSRGSLAAGGGNGNGDSALLSVIGNGTDDRDELQLSVVSSVAAVSVGSLGVAATRTTAANANGVIQTMGRVRRNGATDDRSREGGPPGTSGSNGRDRDGGGDTGDGSSSGSGSGGAGGNGKSSRDAGSSETSPVIRLRGPVQEASDREGPGMVLLPPPTARAPAVVGLALASLSSLQTYDPTLMEPALGNSTVSTPTGPLAAPPPPPVPETTGAPPALLPKPLAAAIPSAASSSAATIDGFAVCDAVSNGIMVMNATTPNTVYQAQSAPASSASNPVPPFHGTALTLPSMQQPLQAMTATTITVNGTVADDRAVQYLDSASLNRLIGTPDDPPGPDFSSCQRAEGEKAAGQVRARRGSSARLRWATDALPSPSA